MLAQIPNEWTSVVCRCSLGYYHDHGVSLPPRQFKEDLIAFICSECGRIDKVGIHRCTACAATFIKDFAHPNWTITSPQCFPCLDADTSRATEVFFMYNRRAHSKRIPPTMRKYYLHLLSSEPTENSFDLLFS